MAYKWSGTIRRCDLIEVGVALLEEVFDCGVGFEVSCAQGIAQCRGPLPVAF